MNVLVINCGSSSLKYQLIDMDDESVLAKGLAERIGIEGSVVKHEKAGQSKVVIEPAPATKGKAMGTMEAPLRFWFLNISIPKTISIAKIKSTKLPAIAKEVISTPKTFNSGSPRRRKAVKIPKEMSDTFSASITFPLALRSRIMGIAPIMSITANKTMNAEKSSIRLKFIISIC